MNFYNILEIALTSHEVDTKERITQECLRYCSDDIIEEMEDFSPMSWNKPSYATVCKIVRPNELPSRKDFDTDDGLATLVHAIAHIEYSAIDLALDAVYRYPQMPLRYKIDWLEVASDEIRHFKMLHELLDSLGYKYGDFPVHSGLFDASINTQESIIDRMAVIPRYYEASGLDVNPQIIKKLKNRYKIPKIKQLIDVLDIIYDEEIVHVQKGDKWFKYLCGQHGYVAEEKYMEILDVYTLRGKHRPYINVTARKKAGFSCDELIILGAKSCN